MLVIAIVGTPEAATRPISSRTPGALYWGSCIASTTRSKSVGSIFSGAAAWSEPARLPESTSISPSRPQTGILTTEPSALKLAAVASRQSRVAWWPASSSLVDSSEPYEAPRIRVRYRVVGGPLLSGPEVSAWVSVIVSLKWSIMDKYNGRGV